MAVTLMTPALSSSTDTTAIKKQADKEKLEKAAKQFEALVLTKMLQSARENSSGGLLGEGGDQASSTMAGMAEEHFAQALAAKGGLGLASMVTKGLIAAEGKVKTGR